MLILTSCCSSYRELNRPKFAQHGHASKLLDKEHMEIVHLHLAPLKLDACSCCGCDEAHHSRRMDGPSDSNGMFGRALLARSRLRSFCNFLGMELFLLERLCIRSRVHDISPKAFHLHMKQGEEQQERAAETAGGARWQAFVLCFASRA